MLQKTSTEPLTQINHSQRQQLAYLTVNGSSKRIIIWVEYSTKVCLKSKSRKCDQVLDNTEDKQTMVQKYIEEILTQTQLCQIFHWFDLSWNGTNKRVVTLSREEQKQRWHVRKEYKEKMSYRLLWKSQTKQVSKDLLLKATHSVQGPIKMPSLLYG